jgi:phosphatidylserine decarboxylase
MGGVEKAPRGKLVPLAREGYPFILISLAVGLAALALGWPRTALLASAAAAFFAFFFRDPERRSPDDEQAIVAPADGRVIRVDRVEDEEVGPAWRVATFMNIFDVHVNRAPAAGTVITSRHFPGRFRAAFREEADTSNERQVTLLEVAPGRRLKVVQIAGLLARRILTRVKPGDHLAQGQRIGMICFGSRVDLYVPATCEIITKQGDHLTAGTTPVARWQ